MGSVKREAGVLEDELRTFSEDDGGLIRRGFRGLRGDALDDGLPGRRRGLSGDARVGLLGEAFSFSCVFSLSNLMG